MSIGFRTRTWWLWAVLSLGAPAARAVPVEVEYAKGVVAYSRSDWAAAEAHFRAVLQQKPEHAEAAAYLGQVLVGLERYDQAVAQFERALGLPGADPASRLDLALALVHLGHFDRAEQQLLRGAEVLGERASIQYYLGFCRFRQGRLHEARDPLRRAVELDGGFAATAGYYLGLVLYRLGEVDQARTAFERVASAAPSGELGAMAQENLGLLSGAAERGEKRWAGFATVGGGYDTNVTLSPIDTSGLASPNAFVAAGVSGSPWRGERLGIELSGSLFRSFYFSEGAEGFALTDLSLVAGGWLRLGDAQQIQAAYGFDLDLLDDRGAVSGGGDGFGLFMQAHSALLGWRIRQGEWGETRADYRFEAQFFDDEQRDNFGHELWLRQQVAMLGGALNLSLGAAGLAEDARGRMWDLWGAAAEVGIQGRLLSVLSLWATVGWRHEDHFRFVSAWVVEGRRVDDRWTAGAGIGWQFWGPLSLGLSYRAMINDSAELLVVDSQGWQTRADLFSYRRHTIGLSLSGRM